MPTNDPIEAALERAKARRHTAWVTLRDAVAIDVAIGVALDNYAEHHRAEHELLHARDSTDSRGRCRGTSPSLHLPHPPEGRDAVMERMSDERFSEIAVFRAVDMFRGGGMLMRELHDALLAEREHVTTLEAALSERDVAGCDDCPHVAENERLRGAARQVVGDAAVGGAVLRASIVILEAALTKGAE